MSKLLVTGASGKLGKLVLNELIASGKVAVTDIIAVSRHPSKLSEYAAKGVDVRAGDFNDPASLTSAFKGADKIAIISTDALDGTDTRLRQHQAAVVAAKAAGGKHIVYTSMPKPEPGSPVLFAPDHYGTEQAVKAAGVPYTILRHGWYMENYFMSLPQALASGSWYTSAADGKSANVAREDCAASVAAALISGGNESATYTLTGPTAYTTEEVAALATKITGKPVSVVHLNDEQLAGGIKAAGVPEGFAAVLVSFDVNTRVGNMNIVTHDVEKLTGKKPQTLEAFLIAHKAALVN